MKRLLFIFLIIIQAQLVFSQGFHQAVGVRIGWSAGFEYRVYADDMNSYRLLLSTRDRGLQIHALKEFHRYDLFANADQLVFVFGGGLHGGYERWDVRHFQHNSSFYITNTCIYCRT